MYFFRTKVGVFSIVWYIDRWHVMFQDESLGGYPTPMSAADDLAGGHCFSTTGNIDTSRLGIPSDISEWMRRPPS